MNNIRTTNQLAGGWCSQMNVQALALAGEGTSISGHIEDLLLRDLPDRLVYRLDVIRDTLDTLN